MRNFWKDKVVLITGSTRGIGLELAKQLLRKDAVVIFHSYKSNLPEELVINQAFIHNRALFVRADVRSGAEVNQMIELVLKKFSRLDVLINNAGITKDNLLMRMSEEDFDKVIDVNLKSVFNMTKAIQKTFLKQRSGSIINMSSVVGVKGNAGQTNYSASKAGVIGFSKSVALELGSRNIRCNVIAPGFIETEMTAKLNEDVVKGWREGIPLKRGGSTEDVANACLFFASDMSSFVTGQVLNVCGGMLT